jgi:hypothetical protein
MSEFGVAFTFGEYKFRAGAVLEDRESMEYYLTTLEYFHEYDFLNGGSKLPKGMWLDVGFLLDTPAVDLIYKEADPFILDAYLGECKEDFEEPVDDYI